MFTKHEISKKALPKETNSIQSIDNSNNHQEEFRLAIGPLSDPWQFRVYLATLTIQKNDV